MLETQLRGMRVQREPFLGGLDGPIGIPRRDAGVRETEVRGHETQVAPQGFAPAGDRLSLQQDQGLEQYALGQELDALQEYLRVEKARFGPDIVWRIDASEEARRTRVPSALVQPLLENAIKYGQETGPRPLRVSIAAQVMRDQLLLEVENSGHWLEQSASRAGRIGLANLRRRLALVYGEAASLAIRDTPSAVKVCLALPARPLR